ncbi:sigma-70 family RNA polymerase sigma factor [Clostridium sp. JS66]|uniref:sigma-70 family RNA polymerase sigma factor n=1 Tax=Clostridium sp. JS66 TaxID=3064705 RepID=UPI00298DD5EC|nr:sigma-70 family RNA polymerase sigma factor [Clostridium sp. JS66]WPC43353.1 sigma-70 family RNA polymerase sigma factor [Clostridium sp. JS66]
MLIILQLLDLVKKAQNGDEASLQAILKNFEGFMYKTASSIYINGYEIEDLIQIEAIALINAVFKYNCGYKNAFTTYAATAIKNAAFNELRSYLNKKNGEKFEFSLNNTIDEDTEFMDMLLSDDNVEEDILLKEEVKTLRKALKSLPDNFREIICWHYFKEKSLKEYAEFKNIKYSAAKKRHERALEKLQQIIIAISK